MRAAQFGFWLWMALGLVASLYDRNLMAWFAVTNATVWAAADWIVGMLRPVKPKVRRNFIGRIPMSPPPTQGGSGKRARPVR